MKQVKTFVIFSAFLFSGALFAVSGCNKSEPEKPDSSAATTATGAETTDAKSGGPTRSAMPASAKDVIQ